MKKNFHKKLLFMLVIIMVAMSNCVFAQVQIIHGNGKYSTVNPMIGNNVYNIFMFLGLNGLLLIENLINKKIKNNGTFFAIFNLLEIVAAIVYIIINVVTGFNIFKLLIGIVILLSGIFGIIVRRIKNKKIRNIIQIMLGFICIAICVFAVIYKSLHTWH